MSLDEQQKKILEDLKSSKESVPVQVDSNSPTPKIPDRVQEQTPELKIEAKPVPQPPLIDFDEPVMKQSENPNRRKNNKYDERVREIINKDKSKGKDDLDEVEKQMLAVQDDSDDINFEKPLTSPENEYKSNSAKKKYEFNDVDSDDLMNVHDSYERDNDLSNDSKIPSNVIPPLDPDMELANFENSNSAYYSNNQGLLKNNGNGHSISQNIIYKNYASIDITGGSASKMANY